MLELNDLLRKAGFDPDSRTDPILVARHSSRVAAKLEALRRSATGDRALFETYQCTQRVLQNERRMASARYLVSLIANRPDTAVFIGMYRIGRSTPLTPTEYRAQEHMTRLFALDPWTETDVREGILQFDLQRMDELDTCHDRLEILFSSPRTWLRKASSSSFPVVALHAEPVLAPVLPRWDTIVCSLNEIADLPPLWRAAMGQWRGVYCITDISDGKSYVGSAAGEENILQRWLDYVATGHGGNVQLRDRNPAQFRFSVLELVSPALDRMEVIDIEERWMRRLQTRVCGLNGHAKNE